MNKTTGLVMVAVLVLGTSCANAASINARQENQHDRIAQGVASGQLTKGELKQIQRHEKRIRELEKRMRRNGLNAAERAKLQRELDIESHEIERLKHNNRVAPGAAVNVK